MSNKIKNTQIKIITINNKTYLPYQLHQLPKFFDKYTLLFKTLIQIKYDTHQIIYMNVN